MFKEQKATILFEKNYKATANIVVNQGGSNSGKTFAITQVLFCRACEAGRQVITVVGQDMPNVTSGVLRDALTIYHSSGILQQAVKSYNKTDRVFEFHNGSIIEFKSYENGQDAKSGKRDYLFVNEANGINYDVFSELHLRTRIQVFIDFNPNHAFWVHDKLIGREGVQLIISDHRHNPFISEKTRCMLESLKETDRERWRVYARGLTGKISGLVFDNWHICEQIPNDAKLIACGLDFGFTNDETACLVVYKQNGELWVEEVLYETGLTNADISARLKEAEISKRTEIIADCAEPKSIEELRRLGWYVVPAKKGADSVVNSIDILKRYRLNITRGSINLRSELERYKWKIDHSGRSLNIPTDRWNHLIDPLRYVALNKLRISGSKPVTSRLPSNDHRTYDFAAMHLLK
jgi:phage terminase large subunit